MQKTVSLEWVDVAGAEEVIEGGVKGIEIGDHFIALYRLKGRVLATSDVCTHAFALLSAGWVDGDQIECPLHGTRFQIQDGRCLGPYGTDLQCFSARERDSRVEVALPSENRE